MDQALELADYAIKKLPLAQIPDEDKTLADLLQEGTREGLFLARDTVKLARLRLQEAIDDGRDPDPKLLRLGNDMGMALGRLCMRVAENEMRGRESDNFAEMLEQIRAAAVRPE